MNNPFFEPWTAPFGAPPFDKIKPEHFQPAYDRAIAEHNAEIAAIAGNTAAPTFENTILAMEDSGRLLNKVESVFWNLTGSHTNDALQAIERDIAPVMAKHWNAIHLNAALFKRVDALFEARSTLELDGEQMRVLERYHLDFVRAGAKLSGAARERAAAIVERLATLGTDFGQNVLGDEQAYVLPLTEADMAGVPEFAKEAAAETAKERRVDAPYAVTTSRSSVEPILQFADNRDLREKLFKAWAARGDNANAHNNSKLIAEMVALRAERAKLLGYPTFAHFKLADKMAKSPENARKLLDEVWAPARKRALEERDALQALIAEEGQNFALEAWDWRYYAEKLRKARYDLDEAEIKPYFQLEKMIEAAFHTAHRLFGLEFAERHDIPVYHPDVRVWEVTRGGQHVGLFYGDYFARASKRGGAWMSSFRDQENLGKPVTPLIVNNCNFPKGEPALLSFDEAKTLFHEFGHALHGLLSQVRFPRLSGTNVATDFVELPSQIYEHWMEVPETLSKFAVHAETGQPIPQALLDKLTAARNFNKGFATVEFLGSALVDMDYHSLSDASGIDPAAFQKASLERIGMPKEIAMRHASPHFLHVFSGDGYSAGYYSYLWSEVLDADGFAAFTEKKDAFDPATAKKLHDFIYSSGGTRDFAEAYRLFRGRDPKIDALLEGRGLAA
ncbi:MAG: M3 family metallopeptidase [Alphaproteobacteria bacterium]|nr:M3 family metallopeptidase [Alphaproteobacteria bacterium]MBV9539908.1 M3 family metallopeptidase [Alphaproteobacteria bacterium]MBV9903612.1 M3 family metallopeptidase [Alphaproteobacteria bacterium]